MWNQLWNKNRNGPPKQKGIVWFLATFDHFCHLEIKLFF